MINVISMVGFLAAAPAPSGLQPKNRPYDAQHYKLELRLGEGGTFSNVATITVKATKALPEIELDAYDLKISSAKVDGEVAEFKETYAPETRTGIVKVKPKKAVAAGKDAVVEIAYTVTAGTSNEGIFTSQEPDANALPGYFTHFEPAFAQRFFPVNDTPADKATSEVFAIVDGRYNVVSNGTKALDEKFAEGGQNLRRVHWKQEQPHSPYLIAVAIGQLEPVLVNEEIPSNLWVPPGRKGDGFVAQDVLKGLYNFQVGYTGTRFPFSKLDVVAVPRFFWSGMENTSVIFERTSALLVDHKNDHTARSRIVGLLSHEMAHQYFGDWVTCAWWNDVWLNEGFATYLGGLAADDYADNDEHEVRITRSLIDGYFTEEDGPRSHPLVVKGNVPVEEAFDSTSYTKGAHVLRMLELWIGKPEMKKVLKAYLEKHGGKAVTSDDFFKVVYEVTKKEKELKPFKEAWLTKKGYPVIFPDSQFSGGKLTVKIRQQPNQSGEKGPFVFKLPIVIHRATEPSFTKEEIITVDKPEVTVTIDVPAAPQWINWNKNFGALVKVNPTSLNEDRLTDAARSDEDPTWRLLSTLQLLGELINKSKVEEVKPTDSAMGAIFDVLQKDPSPYVREVVLQKLANTRFKKLPPEFATILLALAKRPENLNEDPAGYIRVRVAAMEALARVDSTDGHKWMMDELGKREIDINYLRGYAAAAARLGTASSLGTLRAAIVTQKGRGMAYYRRTAPALSLATNTDALAIMRDVFKANPGNNELGREVLDALQANKELRETTPFAAFVRDGVLDEATYTEEIRADLITYLDDVKYDSAKIALTEIVAGTKSERLKASAQRVLDANFPAPPPAKPEPKKKK